jgi:hypothetical protein
VNDIRTWPPSPACFSDHFPRVRCGFYENDETGEITPIYLHSREDVDAAVAFFGEGFRARWYAALGIAAP